MKQIKGQNEVLQGGYATLEGFSYAVPPCTGSCDGSKQDLAGFAAALEKSPLSICVNAGAWNDYTGGVMSAQACGPSGAQYQDHCVMATGFNATAPTPYWIVRNSWSSTWGERGYIYLEMKKNTCGLADDATIPHVKLDLSAEEEAEASRNREVPTPQTNPAPSETLNTDGMEGHVPACHSGRLNGVWRSSLGREGGHPGQHTRSWWLPRSAYAGIRLTRWEQ